MSASVRLDDLTQDQRALVLALIEAEKASDTKRAAPNDSDKSGTAKVGEEHGSAQPTT